MGGAVLVAPVLGLSPVSCASTGSLLAALGALGRVGLWFGALSAMHTERISINDLFFRASEVEGELNELGEEGVLTGNLMREVEQRRRGAVQCILHQARCAFEQLRCDPRDSLVVK